MNQRQRKRILTGTLIVIPAVSILAVLDYLREIDWPPEPEEPPREFMGYEEWEKQQVAHEELQTRALNLNERYVRSYMLLDTRHQLYRHRNFDLVEKRLATRRDNKRDPFERYRYSVLVSDLGNRYGDETIPALLSVVDEWAKARPHSYYPLLIRGSLYDHWAWEHRGSGRAHEVSEEQWEKYYEYKTKALAALKTAERMNLSDPEIPATLADVVAGVEGLQEISEYYKQTLQRNPYHVNVRFTLMNFLQPQWYGSWELLEEFHADTVRAMRGFPYLFEVYRGTASLLDKPRRQKEQWNSQETFERGAAAFRRQLAQTPNEIVVLSKAAFYHYKAGDLAAAAEYFAQIGNSFSNRSNFDSLYDYHKARMDTLLKLAEQPGIRSTPKQKEFLDRALAIEPTSGPLSWKYLTYLDETRNDDHTRAFFDAVRDPYIRTGSPGVPPDYDYIRALALADRAFWDGERTLEEERRWLDQAMELAPDNAFVRLINAEHYIRIKDYDEARVHLEKAREHDPDYQPALLVMGWLNYHQKRWDAGIACAEEFLTLEPSYYRIIGENDAKEIIELCKKKRAGEAAE